MTEIQNPTKHYDLEDRTYRFAFKIRGFVKNLSSTISNQEDGRQLIRSSGSVGANYIEANESISRKDFLFRIKICRKKAKESIFWLKLLSENDPYKLQSSEPLIQEAIELGKIFGSILEKSK